MIRDLINLIENAQSGAYDPETKYRGAIPEIKFLPVACIHRQEMDHMPEVMSVSDEVAQNMDFSEPVEVTAFHFSRDHDPDKPQVTLRDGHHRTAAAIQTGRPFLPVEVRAINAKGTKLNALIALSRQIEGGLNENAQDGAYPIKGGKVEIRVREMRGRRYSFTAWIGDDEVAVGEFQADQFGDKGSVEEITVMRNARRRGIATAIYNHFEKMGFRVVPSDDLKPDGRAFWDKRGS